MDQLSPEVKNYIDILEKTNQQLGFWQSQNGIIVATLSVLFTIITIVAVFIIYRQSQEHKNRLEEDRKLYKKKLDDFLTTQMKVIKQRDEEAEKISKKINKIISGYQKKLEDSSKEQKEEIQKVIDKLEIEKLSLSKESGPITVMPDFNLGNSIFKKQCTCSHCGYGFYVNTGIGSLTMQTASCPKCGSIKFL
ncbi:MAG: hypothetical protein WCW17_02715 [Patescibacteria group bacterium]|jgi:hypothetical protein